MSFQGSLEEAWDDSGLFQGKWHWIQQCMHKTFEGGLYYFHSVQFSGSVVSNSWPPMNCSMPGFPVHHHSWNLLKLMSIESVMPSNNFILCCPLFLLPSIFSQIRILSMSHFFTSGGQSIGVSTSTSVLPMNMQDWFSLGWTCWISLSPKDSQESSPTPQFKRINSSVLSFFHTPILISTHDHWKNHSFD